MDSLLDNLKELSSVSLELHRHKLLFDQDLVGSRPLPMVHHIVPFQPIVRYAASEYLPMKRSEVREKEGTTDAYVSMNVIPDDHVTWLVLSHPAIYTNVHNQQNRQSCSRLHLSDARACVRSTTWRACPV